MTNQKFILCLFLLFTISYISFETSKDFTNACINCR